MNTINGVPMPTEKDQVANKEYVDGVTGKVTYTENEQEIGTWINGKTLYRQVKQFLKITLTNTWENIWPFEDYVIPVKIEALLWNKQGTFAESLPTNSGIGANISPIKVIFSSIDADGMTSGVNGFSGEQYLGRRIDVILTYYKP